MSIRYVLSRGASVLVAAVFAAALTGAVLAATQFEGIWNTQDTKGNPFRITLMADGKAKGDRADEGLKGNWKTDGDSAVITWDSGWVTKITKQGDKFQKQAFEKGESGSPSHTASAQRL